MPDWYYSANDKQLGPVAFEVLQGQAKSGALARHTLVWQEGWPEWKPAGEVQGLFNGPPPLPPKTRPAPPPLPAAGRTPGSPPATLLARRRPFEVPPGSTGPDARAMRVPPASHGSGPPDLPQANPAEQWYYEDHGRKAGPLGFEAIVALCRSRTIQPSTMVWNGSFSEWLPAQKTQLAIHLSGSAGAARSVTAGLPSAINSRSIALATFLTILTLGMYPVYVWACDINALSGREKYSPGLALALSIVTLGIAAVVYICVFAYDIQKLTEEKGVPNRKGNLGGTVLAIMIVGNLLSIFFIAPALATAYLIVAYVQTELNLLADAVQPA